MVDQENSNPAQGVFGSEAQTIEASVKKAFFITDDYENWLLSS